MEENKINWDDLAKILEEATELLERAIMLFNSASGHWDLLIKEAKESCLNLQ